MTGRLAEAALLGVLGAALSSSFIAFLLEAADQPALATHVVGWAFFLWPGVVDSLALLIGGAPVVSPHALIGLGGSVGALTGAMDGFWGIHRWRREGAASFVADLTWGLAGTTQGCLVHLVNLGWGQHVGDRRLGAHRYDRGFAFRPDYAVTLGSVCGNLRGPSGDLLAHEYMHVLQNRWFGPLYTLTYAGWMVVFLIPASVWGLTQGAVGRVVKAWCYDNNPWEWWAYRHGGGRDPALVWSERVFRAVALSFFLGVLTLSAWVVATAW